MRTGNSRTPASTASLPTVRRRPSDRAARQHRVDLPKSVIASSTVWPLTASVISDADAFEIAQPDPSNATSSTGRRRAARRASADRRRAGCGPSRRGWRPRAARSSSAAGCGRGSLPGRGRSQTSRHGNDVGWQRHEAELPPEPHQKNPSCSFAASDIRSLSHGGSQTISTHASVTLGKRLDLVAHFARNLLRRRTRRARERHLHEHAAFGVHDDVVDQAELVDVDRNLRVVDGLDRPRRSSAAARRSAPDRAGPTCGASAVVRRRRRQRGRVPCLGRRERRARVGRS